MIYLLVFSQSVAFEGRDLIFSGYRRIIIPVEL